ncbi:unnamed protein product [Brugia pahangi]|uniref:GRANULINS domain-containing protein n=1 Tax=Brugia pahangi TaxID=6280 RepID=A0A0N4T6R1_BRUPA|nr:unnamed protein product [Brugia pahangi]
MMDAVCCNDLIHCCPPATKCDMIHRQCLQVLNFRSPFNFYKLDGINISVCITILELVYSSCFNCGTCSNILKPRIFDGYYYYYYDC